MKKVGVIAEYNPFHNGHLYHLNKVKEMFPNDYLILVLIGNFTQRGDVSIINKWDKTKLALNYGYDLVVELPFLFATSSANYYSQGSIDILNILECDYLVFGSETNDIELFKSLVYKTNNNSEYEAKIKTYLSDGYNYPKACSLALKDVSNAVINKPNDVLGLEYVRSIINTNSNIIPISIKRTNGYHEDNILNDITSATSIRKNINNKDIIENTLPKDSLSLINNISLNDYFSFLKYQIITNTNLNEIDGVDEGIENKLKKEIYNANTVDDLILKIKSKRYSYNRLKRMLLHILCNNNKCINKNIGYIRVLGLNNNGSKILKNIKNKTNIPIITKYKKEYEDLLKDDINASKIYSLISNYNYKDEYKSSIKKD